jgi:hypothetical protein
MNNSAANMYALSIDQMVNAIGIQGHKRTVLVQGQIGTGKSSILKMLAENFPKHLPCYFDCTTKDLGDITLPNIAKLDDGTGYVTYLTNEELGAHHLTPIILMLDELGKANPAVKLAVLRLMLERMIGSYKLHPDSIVFATSNLGAEGVGDLLPAHARNRLTVSTMRKSNNLEWIEWGINNDIDHTLLGFAKDNPQCFYSFEDQEDPEENPYIFHPRSNRSAFVTPRSLEAASDWLKDREGLDDQTLTSMLIGTIGDRAAMDLMAFVKLADQLPSAESIKSDPMNAKVPDSAAAVCMVVYRALASIERSWVSPWMKYMSRLGAEAQGLFVNGVRDKKYSKQSVVMTNGDFTEWARNNNYMFAADKK